ncbi:hypothetical protein CONCODRAFT_77392 [Conidiobolus coronatus NRRL 28638]|uniref:RING-type E3 ubiquitin transferase n=1 Tax=Conidiobolus coronatus (strain ATCC 28846 / CBS 209.66 / NRRL 28638) TaxID=796925 RepID=A0A137PEA9_CONC2|nr:hypothetical protein CONCODRAFT_77392 [Conidiobolus coronatus NRRL 28638]|eukprot:KXN73339.1 hypothetical protein CONCODRAFT_77392 [Conidiobolus coronatus NRRL 28638]
MLKLNINYDNIKYKLQSNKDKTVSELIKTIKGFIDLDERRITLLYQGKYLEKKKTLGDYNIKDNAVILLHYKDKKASKSKKEITKVASKIASEFKETGNETEAEAKLLAVLGIDINDIPLEDCPHCDNKETSNCSFCGCNLCHKKVEPEKQNICEKCQMYFHIYCLPTPLKKTSEKVWHCHNCSNKSNLIAGAEKSAKPGTDTPKRTRNNGSACTSMAKKHTIIPSANTGKIPGIPVGSWWEYRTQVSESRVHCPPVSGIAGTSKSGSVSIVLAGGYEEDADFGDEFYYTGSGGREIASDKRYTGKRVDQELTLYNLALAINCDAPVNTENGALARDWKKSKPVRVIRNYKLKRHYPKYAPKTGNRYDGLYKLVRYWKEIGKEGYIVWRYHYRRDDDEPAPWTQEGKKIIKKLESKLTSPQNANTTKPKAVKRSIKNTKDFDSSKGIPKKKFRVKIPKLEKILATRSFITKPDTADSQDVKFEVSQEVRDLITQDSANSDSWNEIVNSPGKSVKEFLGKIREEFNCPICFNLVLKPITTNCAHNACSSCLKNSVRHYGNKCPLCRTTLFEEVVDLPVSKQANTLIKIIEQHSVNENLAKALVHFFPKMRKK